MCQPKQIAPVILSLLLIASGCNHNWARADLTLRCGVEALAAGSPKAAIPFLSQVVTSEPDAPEPRAMLAIAYALDLQSDLAVKQARLVRRDPKTIWSPGWEYIAMGVAAMSRHDPSQAIAHFQAVRAAPGAASSMKRAATQWLVLALLLKGDHNEALVALDRFALAKDAATTALLWSVLIHGHKGSSPEAAKALRKVASQAIGQGRLRLLQTIDLTKSDDQDLCDAGIAAIRQGQAAKAHELFMALHLRSANARDAQVWLALLAASEGKWSLVRDKLKAGSEKGPLRSRGLACQLLSVVCALEGRPQAMIQRLLRARRLDSPSRLRIQVPEKPKADSVLVHW